MHPASDKYETVIGLEVHCQLATKSKLFCGCSTAFGALPNHHTCPVCLGYPGALPVLNSQALEFAVRFALGVKARVNTVSVFARKQYFYPDLPKGYQISQYELPFCVDGQIVLDSGKTVPIMRAHLEEDAGKNIHAGESSFVDLNRAGIPLIEVVTLPEIYCSEDAVEYLKKLRAIVRYLEICDGNLEEGSFRCDANVSIRPRGEKKLGTRCEIKNLNSFKNIDRAIRYEVTRQADVLDGGEQVRQATMLFDPASGKTRPMRSKEEAHDYRYFPDPDLRPLVISTKLQHDVANRLPELPEAVAERLCKAHGLNAQDAAQLTLEKDLAKYFEDVVALVGAHVPAKIAANWVLTELQRVLNERGWQVATAPITPQHLGDLLRLLGQGTISGKIAKMIFEIMVSEGGTAEEIMKKKNLVQVSDSGEIAALVDKVIADSARQLEEYRQGKEKVFAYFVGQVMRHSGGKFNPEIVNKILKEKLNAKP